MQDEYRTKDIYISSLLSLSEKLIRLESEADFFWFIFENKKSCKQKINKFWLEELKVEPKSFINAIKNLKSRVFVERRETS